MDLLVSGWNFKQFAIPVSPPPPLPPPVSPPSTATTCSFYKPPSSAHKVSSPFRTYRLARISNKSSSPFAIHARKKNSKSEPLLEPTLVEEVSMDDDDEEDELLLFDDFEDEWSLRDEIYTVLRIDLTKLCSTPAYVGDGAGGGGISLAGTWWDKEALLLAEDVCQSFGGDLGIYAFKTLSNSSIQVRIERLTNKSGSPSMEDIEAFSVSYRAKLDEAELARSVAENITLEVSSPGVERVVRIPQDLDRFKDRSLYVKYVTEVADSGKLSEADGVFRLVSFDMETKCCIWGLADVRINREKAGKGRPLSKKQREWRLETSFDSLRLVRLYSEI
ncbi:Ribosome maturation factor RimP [Gossypium australe]|uniref:Ribosome maturation factor RimP n=1 Tax=Gossypium australe TaxID=47621 RepID=A0A5B6U6J7_9ROSI|nr:Ribosome maturation factor RimP [Gossypium australe]